MLRTMHKSKIHRATVTQADLHRPYPPTIPPPRPRDVGSLTADAARLDALLSTES